MKSFTDLEQSKKLIELGLDVNTADFLYTYDFTVGGINGFNLITPLFQPKEKDIPSWSLSALLRLIPSNDKADEYYVETESHSDCHIVRYKNCLNGYIHSEYSKESLLDAAFEMIVWLKENKKI